MLERRTGDSRNDVGLSPGGIVRHVDLEIGSFAGDISLYLALAAAAAAAAADAVVSLFRVGSSGGAATSAELLVLLLLVLVLVLVVAVNNRSSIFFGFGFFFFCSALLLLCLRRCGIWSQKEEWRNGGVLVGIGGKGRTVNLWWGERGVCERVCVFVTPCQNWERKRERERLRRSWLVTLDLGVVLCCVLCVVSLLCHCSNFELFC